MLISLMALSPQRKLHSGLSGQIKLAIYGLLSLALTQPATLLAEFFETRQMTGRDAAQR
ncbi:hypothetical protein [Candidatus Regiella endosymbiont of Tuberolachnus salignus]|uniref:hypothetical protein n=1 Tax=Candidatus Regiella endosymbiont of Tuberolachnus salignus TaxID=3077956 RepID=UPI0030D0937D